MSHLATPSIVRPIQCNRQRKITKKFIKNPKLVWSKITFTLIYFHPISIIWTLCPFGHESCTHRDQNRLSWSAHSFTNAFTTLTSNVDCQATMQLFINQHSNRCRSYWLVKASLTNPHVPPIKDRHGFQLPASKINKWGWYIYELREEKWKWIKLLVNTTLLWLLSVLKFILILWLNGKIW